MEAVKMFSIPPSRLPRITCPLQAHPKDLITTYKNPIKLLLSLILK